MYVHVVRANGGVTTFQESVADVFASDELTVTCTDASFHEQHGPLRVFRPGTWREATVYRDNGFPDYGFTSAAYRAELAKQSQAHKGTDDHDRLRKTTSAA